MCRICQSTIALLLLFLLLGTGARSEVAGLVVRRRSGGTYVGFLRAQGPSFVDAAGNMIILRGANFEGYEYGLLSSHTEADYQKIASWGFNIVRLPIAWNWIEPSPNQYDDSYLANSVDRDLAWAQEYSIHVIIDMHQYCWSTRFSYCDEYTRAGLPTWAASGYTNTEQGRWQSYQDFWNGLGPNGTQATQSNPSMQDRFFAMWQHVASRYSSATVVAGYDIFNEPYDWGLMDKYDPSSLSTYSNTILPQFYTKAIDSIRAVDPNHVCLWTSPSISSMVGLPRTNVAYTTHYPGYDGYSDYDALKVKSSMDFLAAQSQTWNVPVFIGEWGMLADGNNVANYIRDFSDLLDKYLMSSAWWTYFRGDWKMDLLDPNGNERTILTQNLIRPYVGIVTTLPTYLGLSTDMKQLQIGIQSPCTITVYVAPFSGYSQVEATSGSASGYWAIQNLVMNIAVTTGANTITIQFA
jgi:aryl-phospho-beta-D-glucosidase BglC (GH1 family)